MGTTPELIFKKLGLNKPSLIEDKKTKYIQEVEETRFFLNEKSIEKINTYFGDIRIAIYARLTFISKSIFARFDSIEFFQNLISLIHNCKFLQLN